MVDETVSSKAPARPPGSIKNPHYIGGGVAFGPRNNANFENSCQRKCVVLPSSQPFSKGAGKRDHILELEAAKPVPKVAALGEKTSDQARHTVVLAENEGIEKSARNVANVKTILVNYMNIKDLMKYSEVLFMNDAIAQMEKVFANN